MKTIVGFAASCMVLAVSLGVGLGHTHADEKGTADQKTLMKRKLNESKTLLEGLALEDYEKIAESANQLNLISMEAQWTELLSPRYGEFGAEFRRAVDRVKDMAEKENLDGATLNFMNVIMTCVQCHNAVRGEENIASLPDLSFLAARD